ncbi:MarP family serine protease [Stomatohabitans albus]|uniref:MarP family serine protease n=1 Tax=Stomatohabitans albus TaxID=3110766 RepID=UPI00300CD627
MNVVDIVLALVLLLAAYAGFRRGAFSQIIAVSGALIGLWCAAQYGTQLTVQIVETPGLSRGLVTLAIACALIGIGYAIASIIGDAVSRTAANTWLAPIDRVGGLVTGLLQGLIGVWLVGAILAYGPVVGVADAFQHSMVAGYVQRLFPTPPQIVGRLTTFLDTRGFTQAYADVGAQVVPPELNERPTSATVGLAESAGRASVVRVTASGCRLTSHGSGVAVEEGLIVTNAHVVAGASEIVINDVSGEHVASVVAFDPLRDVAVLDSPESKAAVIPWTEQPVERGAFGATLGFPAGAETVTVRPAGVRDHLQAQGYDIYGQTVVTRDILALSSGVRMGDSGGPVVLDDGSLAGIVFAAATSDPDVGYALSKDEVLPVIERAGIDPVHTGSCRY